MEISTIIDSQRSFDGYQHNLLADKIAVITGGSRGIGKCVAESYAQLGAKVVILYAGNKTAADDTLKQIESFGGKSPRAFQCDVSSFSQVTDVFKLIEKDLGFVDILVNNAGISKDGLFVRFKEEDWDATIATNLKGNFNCCRAVTPSMMRRRQGKIINVASVIGLTGNVGQAAYAASKSGIIGLTRSLAREFATRNMQINAILPGYIHTEMTETLTPQTKEAVLKNIPMNLMGSPNDVANLAVFLASRMSDYVTGQKFIVDGGMAMY